MRGDVAGVNEVFVVAALFVVGLDVRVRWLESLSRSHQLQCCVVVFAAALPATQQRLSPCVTPVRHLAVDGNE